MREIKFRAWSFDPVLDEPQMLSHEDLDRLDREGLEHLFDVINGKDKYIIPMQYTGLKDKFNVPIYEGDVLRTEQGICSVIWSDAAFALLSPGSEAVDWEHSSVYEKSEVIGNIHQHKHLLS